VSGRHGKKSKGLQKQGATARTDEVQLNADAPQAEPEHDRSQLIKQRKIGAIFSKPLHQGSALSNVALWSLFVTSIVAVVYIFQLRAMRESNRINREALVSVQRAFLYVDEFQMFIERNADDPTKINGFTLYPRVKNSGTTPALDATDWVNIKTLDKPITPSFTFPDLDSRGNVISVKQQLTPGFFPPQSVETLAVPLGISARIAQDVNAGKAYVYLYGWIRYRDVFKETEPHVSMFCIQIKELRQVAAIGGNPASTTLVTNTCSEHNCVDKQCEKGEQAKAN